jgi:hypothetical protein
MSRFKEFVFKIIRAVRAGKKGCGVDAGKVRGWLVAFRHSAFFNAEIRIGSSGAIVGMIAWLMGPSWEQLTKLLILKHFYVLARVGFCYYLYVPTGHPNNH